MSAPEDAAKPGDLVDRYLDELTSRLRGPARRVRRVLAETEEHLRDAVDSRVAGGMSVEEAERAALHDFGTAAYVAAAMNQADSATSRPLVLRAGLETLAGLAALGMVVVGVAGVMGRLLAAVTSTETMFGAPASADLPAASCRHWLAVQPSATTCHQAATLESASDQTAGMIALGLLGLLTVTALAVLRRRTPHAHVLPAFLAPTIAATAFGAAGVGLAALAASNAVIFSTWGQGLWWTSACCSLLAALACASFSARALIRTS